MLPLLARAEAEEDQREPDVLRRRRVQDRLRVHRNSRQIQISARSKRPRPERQGEHVAVRHRASGVTD